MTASKKTKQKQKQASGVDTTSSSQPRATAQRQTQGKGDQSLSAFWDSLRHEQQLQLLKIDLKLLQSSAYHVSGQPKLGEVLDNGLHRLREVGKFRQWQITAGAKVFDHATHLWNTLPGLMAPWEELHETLSPVKVKPASAQAKQRLQKQLTGVQHKVQAAKQAHKDLARTKPWRLTKQTYLIDAAITEVLSGHEILYSVFADPLAHTIWELSPHGAQDSQPPPEAAPAVDFELLDMAVESGHIDVAQVSDWVETKIDSLCKLAEHGVDFTEEILPLTLSGSKAAATLAVSERWLQRFDKLHQAKASSSTSSQAPSNPGLACHAASGDAVLSWLYDRDPVLPCTHTLPGSMARKTPARAAVEQLENSHDEIVRAADRAEQLQELIKGMQEDVKRPCNLKTHHESRFRHQHRLPPRHMQSILRSEHNVCKADMFCISYKLYLGSLRLLRTGQRLSQANAQYRHLHIVEQAIQQHSIPMLHCNPAASDHQRAHVGTAMIHEYDMNAKAMKELRKSIQALTDHSTATEREQLKLNDELDTCSAWSDRVAHLGTALGDLAGYFDYNHAALRPPGLGVSLPEQQLKELSDHFHQDLQGKLCSADRQAALLKSLQTQHELVLQHLDGACAVLELLRAQVLDAACDDPSSQILPHLVVPIIKERLVSLEAKALNRQGANFSSCGSDLSTWWPSWDPRWPRGTLAITYQQDPAIASCVADIHLDLLQLPVNTFVTEMHEAGYKEVHMTFVDDSLLAQQSNAGSVDLLTPFGSTVLGCALEQSLDCACLAALLFLS